MKAELAEEKKEEEDDDDDDVSEEALPTYTSVRPLLFHLMASCFPLACFLLCCPELAFFPPHL